MVCMSATPLTGIADACHEPTMRTPATAIPAPTVTESLLVIVFSQRLAGWRFSIGFSERQVPLAAISGPSAARRCGRAAGGLACLPILVDCDDETRSRRLSVERKQPDLVNDNMMNWARYLRREAKASHCEILDTSTLSPEQCILFIMERICAGTHF
jgi:hypothetical protein